MAKGRAGSLLLTMALVVLAGCERTSQKVEQPLPVTRPAHAPAALASLRATASANGSAACPVVAPALGPHRGALYYAAPDGRGGGLLANQPGRLQTVLEQLVPGDMVVVQAGDYGSIQWPAGVDGRPEAPITLRAEHLAVNIAGEPPDLVVQTIEPAARTRLSLTLHDVEAVRIEGIYGRIEVEGGNNIELRANHHFENPGQNVQLFDIDAVNVHHSLFENYRLKPGSEEDWVTDYGIAAYVQTRLGVHHNVFSGGFNHAISLKERSHDITVSCNRFTNCGRHCLELGQQTDGRASGKAPVDRTSARLLVQNNLIEKTDAKLVNGDFAVMVMNINDVELSRNRFVGFDYALLVASYDAPSNCSDLGETMSQIGTLPKYVRLTDNSFEGEAELRFTGRGVAGDLIEVDGLTGGPLSCELRTLPRISCDAACCRWDPSPATAAAPTLKVRDRSLSCQAAS